MTHNRPFIHIYHAQGFQTPGVLENLSWGMEEEGIPYFIKPVNEECAVKLGYSAALDSVLDVGIGVGSNGTIVLHFAKLEENKPLFVSNASESGGSLRSLGANAARLVKGIPFKTKAETEDAFCPAESYNMKEIDIAAVVTEVVKRILQK